MLAPLCRADVAKNIKLVPALGWDIAKQGGFPVSIASDAMGNVWVGTEGNGLWKYDAGKKNWTQFTSKDGLGDDCVYALAFDRQNRLWAGHLNHGVSVYNGDKWQNYGLLDGPIGDRVFAIAVSPLDGDVWIATDMGLARYSEARQDWDYYTRASGLPSDQIQSIAFDATGSLYAGTQCEGIAMAGPDDSYQKWHSLPGPATVPATLSGDGLPGNMINHIMHPSAPGAAHLIIASTPFGQAITSNGSQWSFMHGQDSVEYQKNSVHDIHVHPPLEDWITTVQTSGTDTTWIGYRKSGVEGINGVTNQEFTANVEPPHSVVIRSILAVAGQPPLFAGYDQIAGGLLTLENVQPFNPPGTGGNPSAAAPKLPAPVPPPAVDDAKVLGSRLGTLTLQIAPGEAFFLADDWRTQGDWVGRYGSGYVKLCGMADNGDQDYALQPGYDVSILVGPHHEANAAGPVWFHDNDSSDDLRSLYDPSLGHRRDAEENDFSYDTKTYPESYAGPDLWVRAKVPDGVHCLSLYFLNNDAHTKGGNKYRDYDVQVLSDDEDLNKVQASTPLARTRVTDFWGGVCKQFLVRGPASYIVRIGRNRSFVTKLQGVFLDRVTGDLPDNPGQLPGFDNAPYAPPDEPDNYHPTPLTDAAVNLWSQLDDALSLRGAVSLQMPFRIWCYRAAIAGQAPPEILERWRWQISVWTPEDRKKFDDAMKAAHDAAR
jgi:hypothetical protein